MFIRNVATRLPDAEDLGAATPCRLFKSPAQCGDDISNCVTCFGTSLR